MKPILSLPKGRLRPALATDLLELESLLHEPEVRRFLCDDKVLSRAEVEGILAESLELDDAQLGLWVIESEASEFAGIVGLAPVSPEANVAISMSGGTEPTVAVFPAFAGQGRAYDAMIAVLEHAAETLKLAQLVAAVDRPNIRSHRLMKRLGFQEMGSAPGPAHELVLYRLSFISRNEGDTF